MAENHPRGDRQEVRRGVNSPGGHQHPQSRRVFWGDETSKVTPEGNKVTGAEIQGRGGDGNSPATQDTKGSSIYSRGEEIASRQEPAAPQIPQIHRA